MDSYEELKQICLEMGDRQGYSIAEGNMGIVYYEQGDYTKAMECYDEYKHICMELGIKRDYSIVVGNIGNVYLNQGEYAKAMECYEESIKIGKQLQIKYFLCHYLQSKANLHFILKEYDSSRKINQEAFSIANEIKDKDVIFNSYILKNKLLALESPDKAIKNLIRLLETETEEENQAMIYYEMFHINNSEEYFSNALNKFKKLYDKLPKYLYKQKIRELTSNMKAECDNIL